jgi:hypothetical protein
MAAITTREVAGTGATVLGAPLTNAQVDNNFIAINTELVDQAANTYSKLQADGQALAFAIALG